MRGSARLQKVYLDASTEAKAENILEKFSDQDFSFADAVSFVVMKDLGIKHAFAFDRHFVRAGFSLWVEE